MAASPSFVGTPRAQNTAFNSVSYALQTVFTAGVNGSAIRSFSIGCIADQQLYATVMLYDGATTHYQCTVPLQAGSVADAVNGIVASAIEILDPAYFPVLSNGRGFLELGADEVVRVSVITSTGDPPDVGEVVSIRIEGADY